MNERIFVGTEVKYLVEIVSNGFDMVSDDFEITVKRGAKELHFSKGDLIEETEIIEGVEKHNFYLCFDTAELGPGMMTCIVKAYVPDSDFPDGLRTEVDKFNLDNLNAV